MNTRLKIKHAPFIGTPGTKKRIRKFNHLPPYFGHEMGSGYGKMRKNALMLEFLDRCGRKLDHCVVPAQTRNSYLHTRMFDAFIYPKTRGKINVDFETV
jgi:hypothetical protein